MVKPTKYQHEGQWVDADELDFKVAGGQTSLELEDGTTLKFTVTPLKVIRIQGVYNQDGEPVYQVKWGTAISASVPVALMKPPKPAEKTN